MREGKAYKISEWAFVAAMMVLYLFIACAHIRKPGLQYDEVLFGNVALGAVDPWSFIAHTIKINGKSIPTMTMPYIGALKAYFYMPIFKFFGVSPMTVRLPVVLLGALSLVFTYFFLKTTFDAKVARVALVLTSIDPSFIFHIKLDWGPVAVTMLLKMASLYFLAQWLRTKRTKHLALGGFLNGLALYDKGTFVWYMAGMGLALLLVLRKDFFKQMTLKTVSVFSLFFILGSFPLIQYNMASKNKTFKGHAFLSKDTLWSVLIKTTCLEDTLNGTNVYERINSEQLNFGFLSRENKLLKGNLLPLLLLVSVPIAVFQKRDRWIKVLSVSTAFIFAQIFLIYDAGSSHHFMIAYPFPQVITAWAFIYIIERLSARFKPEISKPQVALVCMVFLAPIALANSYMDFLYVNSFIKIGGRGFWSDAIYDLAEFAKSHPNNRFVLLNWGLNNQLMLLSKGAINREEVCWTMLDNDCLEVLRNSFTDPSNIYVLYAPRYGTRSGVSRFQEVVKNQGLEEKIYKVFYQRDKEPVYVLYQVFYPSLLSFHKQGKFFYLREGEDFTAKSGGDIDPKRGASQGKALGIFWGNNASDFVTYNFSAPRKIQQAYLFLKYAFVDERPHKYFVFIDDNLVKIITLESTGGYGYKSGEWRTFKFKLGDIETGQHTLKIKPADDFNLLNLDLFFICEGECDLQF